MDEANREYKSGLFCDIFGTKRRLSELHTALTDIPVTEADIIINTLMTVIYGKLKNDLSYEARGKRMRYARSDTPARKKSRFTQRR